MVSNIFEFIQIFFLAIQLTLFFDYIIFGDFRVAIGQK